MNQQPPACVTPPPSTRKEPPRAPVLHLDLYAATALSIQNQSNYPCKLLEADAAPAYLLAPGAERDASGSTHGVKGDTGAQGPAGTSWPRYARSHTTDAAVVNADAGFTYKANVLAFSATGATRSPRNSFSLLGLTAVTAEAASD